MAIPQLSLGSMNLTDWSGSAYATQVMAQGVSKGSPQPLEVSVQSWLQDGSIVFSQGYDNRIITLRVKFRGTSLTACAQAEQALMGQMGRPNTLTWTPASGPAAVFDVLTSSFEESPSQDNDLSEIVAMPWRTYDVRLVCLPFARSATETVVAALPGTGSTTTSLDTCSATTGWSGLVDGVTSSPALVGGAAVAVSSNVTKGSHSFTLQKTFAATTSSTNLLMVDWLPPVGGITGLDSNASRFRATGDGTLLTLIAEGPSPTAGYTRSYFKVAATTLAVTRFDWSGYFPAAVTSAALTIDNVAVTNVNPIIGNARQQVRSFTVDGSAPSPGSLVISSSGTSALGDGTLVYVYAADQATSGYTPALRQFRSSGNTVTTNTALVSGASEPVNGGSGVVFDIPIGLFPRGHYLLMARLQTSGGGSPTITYGTTTTIGGNAVYSTSGTRTLTITGSYANYAIARLDLPTLDLDLTATAGSAGMRLSLQASTACTYDEVWLFNRTIGALIQVDCGSGTSLVGTQNQRLLSIQSPTTTTPRPTIRIGHSDNLSDSYYPAGRVSAWDQLRFVPPQMNVFYVTPASTTATATFTYSKHWHTNPAS